MTEPRVGQRPKRSSVFPLVFVRLYLWLPLVIICGRFCNAFALAEDSKPKVAVFPLGGTATVDQREKVGFSLRTKLDRDGHYESIDGPTMLDLTDTQKIDFATPLKALDALNKDAGAEVLIWGDLVDDGGKEKLRIKLFDLNQPDPLPHEFERVIAQPTDMRFVVEDILQTLDNVKKFGRLVEDAVTDDDKAKALFLKNPNLVVNGDFSLPGHWQALLGADAYPPAIGDALPEEDRVGIYRLTDGQGHINNVLAMNLSKTVAESNGLACLSDPIRIQPNTRYRLQFRYRSDGPGLHVFVKGYTTGKDISGGKSDREVYRRQVPPSEATDGQWVTITCDLNPQHVTFPVEQLRVDLYAYLTPGLVMFDDVQVKAVGDQTVHAVDDAIKPPTARP